VEADLAVHVQIHRARPHLTGQEEQRGHGRRRAEAGVWLSERLDGRRGQPAQRRPWCDAVEQPVAVGCLGSGPAALEGARGEFDRPKLAPADDDRDG
jgi:hypothetical protein